jgi:hypothetical protein
MFSVSSFILQFLTVMCAPALQPPVLDLISHLLLDERSDLLFLEAIYSFGKLRLQCKTLLQFIYYREQRWVNLFSSFFKYKDWYEHHSTEQTGPKLRHREVLECLVIRSGTSNGATRGRERN